MTVEQGESWPLELAAQTLYWGSLMQELCRTAIGNRPERALTRETAAAAVGVRFPPPVLLMYAHSSAVEHFRLVEDYETPLVRKGTRLMIGDLSKGEIEPRVHDWPSGDDLPAIQGRGRGFDPRCAYPFYGGSVNGNTPGQLSELKVRILPLGSYTRVAQLVERCLRERDHAAIARRCGAIGTSLGNLCERSSTPNSTKTLWNELVELTRQPDSHAPGRGYIAEVEGSIPSPRAIMVGWPVSQHAALCAGTGVQVPAPSSQ